MATPPQIPRVQKTPRKLTRLPGQLVPQHDAKTLEIIQGILDRAERLTERAMAAALHVRHVSGRTGRLIEAGLIERALDRHGTLILTDLGEEILHKLAADRRFR